MNSFSYNFIKFSIESGALCFGKFLTKAGKHSPYFFNTGLFNCGKKIKNLSEFYSETIINTKIDFDMIFGPAYKGITLTTAIAISLSNKEKNIPFSFNRKEIKNHGEKGLIVGSKLSGNVIIVDDVISSGSSIIDSIEIIKSSGAKPIAVVVALDRMEKSPTKLLEKNLVVVI